METSKGGGVNFLVIGLIEMCREMGSCFHDRNDYNVFAFSEELIQWGRTFSVFLESEISGK